MGLDQGGGLTIAAVDERNIAGFQRMFP